MIETDSVEGIEQGKLTLNLVSLYHSFEDLADGEWLPIAGQMVCDGKNGSEIVRWVAPFSRKPAIVEIKPTNLCTNVECSPNRVDLVVGARDLGS